MAIPDHHRTNFGTLKLAFGDHQAALVECTSKETGELVYVICAVNHLDGDYQLIPLAKMFDGSAFDEVIPPEGNREDTLPHIRRE